MARKLPLDTSSLRKLAYQEVRGRIYSHVSVVLLLIILHAGYWLSSNTTTPVLALTFQCVDPTGSIIFTDSPAQLEGCTPISDKESMNRPTKDIPANSTKSGGTFKNPMSQDTTRNQFLPDDEDGEEDFLDEEFLKEEEKEEEKEAITASDTPDSDIVVRLTRIGGSFVIQARLNNKRDVHLIVDTGATMTVISYDVATEIGLLSGSDNSINTVHTAGGSVQVSLAKIDHMQVGSAEVQNVDVAIHDLPEGIPGVSGLLGMSFLDHFLVTLDSQNALLHLKNRP